ncbi:hypothetical protein RRG08_025272 [Elysia crispata]|uniref:Uncharacterized protein n=1 Tax=Elysia crispata TaxID=231223 RepID=A0AAE1DVC0_9GAST|nr:hypothetical protein RRG08_025272 [Elysia crispata]
MILLRTSKADFEQDYDIVELKQFESVNVGEYVVCENATDSKDDYHQSQDSSMNSSDTNRSMNDVTEALMDQSGFENLIS